MAGDRVTLRSAMRYRLEYALAWFIVKTIGALPRPVARAVGIGVGQLVYLLHGKLRRVGMRNLGMAFPDKSQAEKRKILRGVFTSLGRQLAEICLFPRYTADNVSDVVIYDGFENFQNASDQGKGVLFLTGHLGGWELSAFAHSLYGHPLRFVMRPLDNPYLDRMVREYRTMHGNIPILKDDPVRGLLRYTRVHAQWPCPDRTPHKRGSRARIHALGSGAAQVPASFRSARETGSYQRQRRRYRG
jgi:KDO2-lipid IV(A) lauroyltransferase